MTSINPGHGAVWDPYRGVWFYPSRPSFLQRVVARYTRRQVVRAARREVRR
jgi:hypothetical protein